MHDHVTADGDGVAVHRAEHVQRTTGDRDRAVDRGARRNRSARPLRSGRSAATPRLRDHGETGSTSWRQRIDGRLGQRTCAESGRFDAATAGAAACGRRIGGWHSAFGCCWIAAACRAVSGAAATARISARMAVRIGQVPGVDERSRRGLSARPQPGPRGRGSWLPQRRPPSRQREAHRRRRCRTCSRSRRRASRTPRRGRAGRRGRRRTGTRRAALPSRPRRRTRSSAKTDAAASPMSRAGRDAGSQRFAVSSAETCQGSKTWTCVITRSLKSGDGAKCGRRSRALTTCRASASSARHFGQFSTCAMERSDAESGFAVQELVDFVW